MPPNSRTAPRGVDRLTARDRQQAAQRRARLDEMAKDVAEGDRLRALSDDDFEQEITAKVHALRAQHLNSRARRCERRSPSISRRFRRSRERRPGRRRSGARSSARSGDSGPDGPAADLDADRLLRASRPARYSYAVIAPESRS